MNVLTYGAEDLNSTFPKFDEVQGVFGFELSAPIYGRASLTFNQSQVQYLGKSFPYSPIVPGSWQGLHFKASAISACGLIQWLTGTSERGDLRFNASSRKLEARVNGVLVQTGNKIFNSDTLYHLQLFLTVNAAYQYIQVKVNDAPIFALNYFSASGASPAHYDKFRWGPFLGGGSGSLIIDDIVLNDSLADTGGDYSWPGRIAITEAEPYAEGENISNQWAASGSNSVPTAIDDELDYDGDLTFAHTQTNRRRHAIKFRDPQQPIGGVLEAVGFDVIARVSNLPAASDSTPPEARLKLRFRSNETPVNEVQTVTISDPDPGDQIQIGYEEVLSPLLAHDISIPDMQAEADVIFGEDGVVVSGTAGEEYIFTFAEHWSQTRLLLMVVGGSFSGAGAISVARTTDGAGIYEAGEPFGYIPPLSELPDDAITDAYPEPLSTSYESRTARRRVALDGGIWSRSKADVVELVIRADLPFSTVVEELPPIGGEESGALNDAALNEVAV